MIRRTSRLSYRQRLKNWWLWVLIFHTKKLIETVQLQSILIEREGRLRHGPDFALKLISRDGGLALESTSDLRRGGDGCGACFGGLLGGFGALWLDNVLGCGVVYLEAICGFLNSHLVLIDHIDQLEALVGLDGVVASLALGERRNRIRKRFRLLGSRCCLRLDVTAHGSWQVGDFLFLTTRSLDIIGSGLTNRLILGFLFNYAQGALWDGHLEITIFKNNYRLHFFLIEVVPLFLVIKT